MNRIRSFTGLALSATLLVAVTVAAEAAPNGKPAQRAPDYLYVCNQDGASVTIIDAAKLEVVKTLDLTQLGFSANAKPHHVVVEPDGSFWYLTLIGENTVLKLTRDNQIVGRAKFEVPGLLALVPARHLLYVGRSMSAVSPPMRIGVIQTGDMQIDEIDTFYPRPHALDLRPQGDFVYSASLGVNQMGTIPVGGERIKLLDVPGPTHVLAHSAIAPDGGTLVITTHSNKLMIFDLADPATPKLTTSLDVPTLPWVPAFSPDGRFVWIPDNGSDDVTVVDMRTRTIATVIKDAGFAQPYGSAFSPDGRYVFIANNNAKGTAAEHAAHAGGAQPAAAAASGSVSVIDAATRKVIRTIPVGKGPTGLGIRHAH
jgi:YVTN family beta-propeller protein